MTAFAVDFQRDRLVVAGDTLGYTPDRVEARPLGYIPKVIPLPHVRGVIFGRGMQAIVVRAAAYLMLSPALYTIEAAAEALPNALYEISEEYADQVGLIDWRSVGLLECVLAGWSEAEGRMRMWSFASYERYKPYADHGAANYGLLQFPRLPAKYAPCTDGMTRDESLVAIIEGAGQLFADPAAQMGGARVGGEVIAIEVRPHGMSQRTLYRFPDYEEMMHAGAATTGRFERGDLDVDIAAGLVPIAEAVDAATGKRVAQSVVPANDQPISRQQRRAAERAARKAERRRA